LALALYSVLALKWYPGKVDGTWRFQEPLRILRFGFVQEWPYCGGSTVCRRPMWPLLLFPVLVLSFFVFYRSVAPRLVHFLKGSFKTACRCEKRFPEVAFRCFFLAALLSTIYVPINRAVGHTRFPTWALHEVVECGLLPIAVPVHLAYFGCVIVVRWLSAYVNPLLVPHNHAPSGPHQLSLQYHYDGLVPEIVRFLLFLVVVVVMIRLLSPVLRRYPRISSAIAVCLCISLAVATVVALICPAWLR